VVLLTENALKANETRALARVANGGRTWYDASGQITSETDDNVDHIFGFTGRERDEESDLYYYRARYYDPSTGQFISEDPIGFEAGDANTRRYVGNSPTNATDPSGLIDVSRFMLAGETGLATPAEPSPLARLFGAKTNEEHRKDAEDKLKEFVLKRRVDPTYGDEYTFRIWAETHLPSFGQPRLRGRPGAFDDADVRVTPQDVEAYTAYCRMLKLESMKELCIPQPCMTVTTTVTTANATRAAKVAQQSGGKWIEVAKSSRSGAVMWECNAPNIGGKWGRSKGGWVWQLDAPKSVGTPYGTAVQDTSAAALRLRSEVAAGRPIFRGGNFPKSAGSDAQFFSPENPLSPGFADRVGAGNLGSKTPDFIMGGRVRPGGNFITRPAPGLGANKGGALEIVNEPGAVQFDFFVMPD